ncbi:60S acidic ribosomal protein P2 [Patella vulgata]|uniref:60S acidic ribosomal protein P2 n=1 Tax=Patella vulgata TaxID=6465 RepID=UPI00217FDBCD|nr:60S acidic ribosomal protein P2 [Patella vulgata]
MRYVAAYLLATLGGKDNPTSADIEKILGSVGIESEADKLKKVVDELKGKKLEDLIAEGQKKLASVPSGGGGAAPAAGTAAPEAAKEEKAAKKPEPESESDEDMGFGLFD